MNFWIASGLWLIGSSVITLIVNNFTGHLEDKHSWLENQMHQTAYQISGMVLMYIFMTFHIF